jgi:DNA polymerase (family 10)
MDRNAVALVLEEIASLLNLTGENKFKARAFSSAARAIEKVDADLAVLARDNAFEALPGIGPATASVIRELLTTGQSRYYDDLRKRTPAGLRALMSVPGLGAGKAKQLHDALGISTLEDLQAAVDAGRIAEVKGFGERTQQRIANGLQFVQGGAGRRRFSRALESAERLLGIVRLLPSIVRADLAGELRRRMETVDGIDVIAAAVPDECAAATDAFAQVQGLLHVQREADRAVHARLADGLNVRFVCVPVDMYAWALWLHTGSAEHVAAVAATAERNGITLTTRGLERNGAPLPLESEADIYDALALQYVPPELREPQPEGPHALRVVEAAAAHSLPNLVELDDLRGTFHCHTTYSDGKSTIEEMAMGALERGWSYLGIADHSQNASYAGGLTPADLRRQQREIDAWNREHPELWLLKGVEADILADGTLDYAGDPGVLESFDYVVGSVHSNFRMSRTEMTKRMLRALDDPRLTILGHMTGRLLLSRDAYALDVEAVIERAAERGVAIEINADPARLDLDWRWWSTARAAGVLCVINPDAHSVRSLDNVAWGINIARKGALAADDILNTKDADALRAWLRNRHG